MNWPQFTRLPRFQNLRSRIIIPPYGVNCKRQQGSLAQNAVQLDYSSNIPPDGNQTNGALVILHGLFGSKRNWSSLTKAFAKNLNRPIYALDLRNQGTSPHVDSMTYSDMAGDVLRFCSDHALTNVSLLGHSMGGKVAMAVALHPSMSLSENSHLLSNLIIEDIAPLDSTISETFRDYIDAMLQIESLGLKTRAQAMKFLQDYESDASIRAFLLTNLKAMDQDKNIVTFQIPLTTIKRSISDIGGFPYDSSEATWNGRVLFLKGTKSPYINRHNQHLLKEFFPNSQLDKLDTGHWMHAEKPNEFMNLVVDFIKD